MCFFSFFRLAFPIFADEMKSAVLLLLLLVWQADPMSEKTAFPTWEEAAAFLAGACELEEMDEEILERFDHFRRNPLRLNGAGRSAMISSGMLSPYQVASILDVRARTGPVVSFTELSMIDGIGRRTADALRYFVVLDAPSLLPETGRFQGEVAVRGGVRAESEKGAGGGASYKDATRLSLECGDRATLSLGTGASYDRERVMTASASFSSRDGRWSVLAGDLNARFGQGLVLWSGMTMSGVSGPDAMVRKGGGVSASSSFTGSGRLRGIAADLDDGRSRLAVLAAESVAALNVNRYWKRSQAGITLAFKEGAPAVSGDFRVNFSGVDVWGEAAVEVHPPGGMSPVRAVRTGDRIRTVPACVIGASWSPEYGTVFAACGRLYPTGYAGRSAAAVRSSTKTSDESGMCLAARSGPASLCADYAFHPSNGRRQLKTLLLVNPTIDSGDAVLTPSLRYAVRWRPYEAVRFRHDLRLDADLLCGDWQFHGRYNTIWYKDRSWAWYCEAVWKKPDRRFHASARAGLFKVDNWDDRIYVYERDLPGCFTVPALYGRGWNSSLTAGLRLQPPDRFRPVRRLDFRAGVISYPWTRPGKPSRFEARVQYSFSW